MSTLSWYKKLWAKFALQLLTLAVLSAMYLFMRYMVPKKYRVSDKKLKDYISLGGVLMGNLAKDTDETSDVMSKAKNILLHIYDKNNKVTSSFQELKLYVGDLDEEVEMHKDWGFSKLIFPKLEKFGVQKDVKEINIVSQIVKNSFTVKGKEINFYMIKNFTTTSDEANYDANFACTKGFMYDSLVQLLFQTMNGIYISSPRAGQINISELDFSASTADFIFNEKLFNKLSEEISRFKAKGIQRSYILYGPPGTGKSSFCFEMSKRASGKVVKLDSTIFTNLNNNYIKSLIENLDCEFIIVDDIDRIRSHDVPGFLYSLETIKNYTNKPTLFATVNNLKRMDKAIVRPGRFESIIDYPSPNAEDRREFITKMLKMFDTTISEEDLTTFVDSTEGMTQAYLKEYCQELRIEDNFQAVLTRINFMQELLKDTTIEDMEKEAQLGENYDHDE